MANTSSAKKMVRKIARRTAINKSRRSRVRTYVKKVELAIVAGDQPAAQEALRSAESELMRAVFLCITPLDTGSRKVSRLTARVKAMSA